MRYEEHIKFSKVAGKQFVTMPMDVYESIIEDLADVEQLKKIDKLAKDIKLGKEEVFPYELTKSILLEGANPLKVYREYREMTQAELAKKSGVTRDNIAAIETFKRNGSVQTIKALAKTLEIDMELIS